jgi:hypothetical protein
MAKVPPDKNPSVTADSANDLKSQYAFTACGSGSSGASRLSANPISTFCFWKPEVRTSRACLTAGTQLGEPFMPRILEDRHVTAYQ